MSFLEVLVIYLENTTLFSDYVIQHTNIATEAKSITLFEQQGADTGRAKGEFCYSVPGLQIILLDKVSEDARQTAIKLTQALCNDFTSHDGVTRVDKATAGMLSLGKDDNNFNRWSLNYTVIVNETLAM